MIKIKTSKTADSRYCDFSQVTKDQLLESSYQHIDDVRRGLSFFKEMLNNSAKKHDFDKITEIDKFHADFITGFKRTEWWENHKKINRHHLNDNIPEAVNLIDILDMIADCIMAGMGRNGKVFPVKIKPEILMIAFKNTVKLLQENVKVKNETI